eukprot:8404673-Karenia_brevis.AAC.1
MQPGSKTKDVRIMLVMGRKPKTFVESGLSCTSRLLFFLNMSWIITRMTLMSSMSIEVNIAYATDGAFYMTVGWMMPAVCLSTALPPMILGATQHCTYSTRRNYALFRWQWNY